MLAFLKGLLSRYPIEDAGLVEFNGETGLYLRTDGRNQYAGFEIKEIETFYEPGAPKFAGADYLGVAVSG